MEMKPFLRKKKERNVCLICHVTGRANEDQSFWFSLEFTGSKQMWEAEEGLKRGRGKGSLHRALLTKFSLDSVFSHTLSLWQNFSVHLCLLTPPTPPLHFFLHNCCNSVLIKSAAVPSPHSADCFFLQSKVKSNTPKLFFFTSLQHIF